MFTNASLTGSKPEQYAQLLEQARGLVYAESDYLYDGKELVVGPFQGLPACVRIPLDKGVCGAAASQRVTQRVDDVDAFPGHIACDSASRSELVVPLLRGEELIGVFDIDSPKVGRFDADDQAGLKLRNIGPKSAAWLRQVGLRSREDLVAIGAVGAFVKVKRAGFKPSLNLLYSLEGALLDCHWQELSEPQREALVQDYEARIAAHPLKAAGPASGPVHEQRFDADDDAEDSVDERADED
jgi:DNA transformation protein and related proteins